MEKLGQFVPLVNIMVFSSMAMMLLGVIFLVLTFRLYLKLKKEAAETARVLRAERQTARRQKDAIYTNFSKKYLSQKKMAEYLSNGPSEPDWQ